MTKYHTSDGYELDLSGVCESGWVYAVYRKTVELGLWDKQCERFPWEEKECFDGGELLELHIFDESAEYRAIRSMREKNGFIIAKINDECYVGDGAFYTDGDMLLYGEEFICSDDHTITVSENGREKRFFLRYSKTDFNEGIYLRVRDYFGYDENHLLYRTGYRLFDIGVGNAK